MKKIIILAIIAIVAMVGAASAATVNILDDQGNVAANDIDIMPGQTLSYTLVITNIGSSYIGNDVPLVKIVEVVSTPGSATAGDIEVLGLPLSVTVTDTDTNGVADDIELDFTVGLDANAGVGSVYSVNVGYGPWKTGSMIVDLASRDFHAIPEFPTVALPIAAILGLAFFMQRRKEE